MIESSLTRLIKTVSSYINHILTDDTFKWLYICC